jgi:hypothetical protein
MKKGRANALPFLGVCVATLLTAVNTEATVEALHLAGRVHDALLTRIERMADRANLHPQLRTRGAGRERIATRTRHYGVWIVIWMNIGLHYWVL